MRPDDIIIYRKLNGGTSAFNLSRIGKMKGIELEIFTKNDKEYGHSEDLAYALNTGQFGFVGE